MFTCLVAFPSMSAQEGAGEMGDVRAFLSLIKKMIDLRRWCPNCGYTWFFLSWSRYCTAGWKGGRNPRPRSWNSAPIQRSRCDIASSLGRFKKQRVGKLLAKTTLQRRLFTHREVEETLRQHRSRTAWSRRERQKDSLRTGTSKSCGFPICGLDEVHPYPYLPEPGGGLVEIHEESQLVAQRTVNSCQTLELGVRVDTKIYS